MTMVADLLRGAGRSVVHFTCDSELNRAVEDQHNNEGSGPTPTSEVFRNQYSGCNGNQQDSNMVKGAVQVIKRSNCWAMNSVVIRRASYRPLLHHLGSILGLSSAFVQTIRQAFPFTTHRERA